MVIVVASSGAGWWHPWLWMVDVIVEIIVLEMVMMGGG